MAFLPEQYLLSESHGFATLVPDSLGEYFQPWHDLASKTINLMADGTLREETSKLPQLDSSRLKEHGELRLAHLQLSTITAGYVWENGPTAEPLASLPANVAVPFADVSDRLGMIACATYTDQIANWELIDKNGPFSGKNFRVRYVMGGGQEYVGFCLLMVEMECIFARALPILQMMGKTAQPKQLAAALREITKIVEQVKEATSTMHNVISVETFFNKFVPFVAGFNKDSGYPDGLLFEGVTNNPRRKTMNAAASQTVIFQVLDRILGVEYPPDKMEAMAEWRQAWPTEHREFFEALPDLLAPVREIALSGSSPEVTSAYNDLLKVISSFRTYHLALVQKYALTPNKKLRAEQGVTGYDPLGYVYPLLKGVRDSMQKAFL